MPTIIKSVLPMILIGLLAGCAGGGGYYSSGGYGGGYGYQPYQSGGSYYTPSSYSYGFSSYGGGNDWHHRYQDRDSGRTFAMNRDQGHWQGQQNESNWKKKWSY
jgi:hypothetical protein